MTSIEIMEFVKKIELFNGLTEKEFEFVIKKITNKELKSGDLLFKENSNRDAIFLIRSGKLVLYKTDVYGRETILAVFQKNEFIGEGSLMDDTPHSTSARALLPTEVLLLQKDFFNESASITVKILSNITRVISRRMKNANSKAISVTAQYESGKTRTEHDLLGYREVPYEYYYGIQTLRALENFNISGITVNFYPDLIKAFATIKKAAAFANFDLGLLEEKVKKAIVKACNEILNGKYHSHFVVDMIQGGAGTSTNMNANEVIANRALEILGYEKGDYKHCHPNNHVNLSQSTNDAYPSSVKIALYNSNKKLISVLEELIFSFHKKAKEFENVIKMGRTQLQDAVPITLGQSFAAYAATFEEEVRRLNSGAKHFLTVNMGGTAIGTGINADPEYSSKIQEYLADITGYEIKIASNLVEATQDTGAFVHYSSVIKRLAIKLSKICNDLRLLSSGPRAGFNEINLPPMQNGSSIMPGKVNPVIPEVVNQIAFKVIGNDLTVSMASEAGQLELNVFEPIIVQSILESVEMLKNGMTTLIDKCIVGITANVEHCRFQVENSIGIVTALNPVLGYEICTQLAADALKYNRSVMELVRERKLLSEEQIKELLDPNKMINPQKMK